MMTTESYQDSFVQATSYLKQAVPLMIKYQIPTTPTHYALWYTYVAQSDSQLNAAVDAAIQQGGSCSAVCSEQLYQTHLASKTERNLASMKQSLEALALELSASMHDTLHDTSTFQAQMDRCFDRLLSEEDAGLSIDETISLVRDLVQGSRQMRHSTQLFGNRLSEAEKEIHELREQLAQSRAEAYEDALTGLLNRRAFDGELQHHLRLGEPFSLIILDIDRFKSINDEYGHVFGDQVLKAVARRLRDACRHGEKAYRIGGEEMAILLPARPLNLARQFAEALRRSVEKVSVLEKRSGRRINQVTASFGVAEFMTGDQYETLMSRTDEQLYRAKSLGRNRVMPMNL